MRKKAKKLLCILLCLLITLSSTVIVTSAAEEQYIYSQSEDSFFAKIFQPIIDFFKSIGDWFRNLFGLNPDYEYALSTSTNELLASGYEEKVIFYLTTNNEKLEEAYLIDNAGNYEADFYDDGDYSYSGDDIAGDGTYSAIVYVDCNEETTESFSVVVDGDKQDISVSINIIAPFTEQELYEMNEVDTQLQDLVGSFDEDYNDYQKGTLVMDLVNDLAEDESLIIPESISKDEEMGAVFFTYTNGTPGGVVYSESEENVAGNASRIATAANNAADFIATQSTDSSMAYVGNAAITYGWDYDYDEDSFYKMYTLLEDYWEENGLDTTINTATTVNEYKTEFLNKDLIVIAEHGTKYTYWDGWLNFPTIYLFTTQQSVTSSMSKQLSADIKAKRVFALTFEDGTTHYCLSPDFFSYYYRDKLNDSIIFFSSCMGFGDDAVFDYHFSMAFGEDCGASVTMGFHNSVYIVYTIYLLNIIVDHLLDGETVQSAINAATSQYGADDVDFAHQYTDWDTTNHPAAYLLTGGDSNARLISTKLENGSFEDSYYPVKWNYKGDVRVINKLGELTPTKGSRMLIITTGIGSKEDDYLAGTEGSYVEQTFIVPSNATTLSFNYNVVSEEPMEYVGSSYDDKFVAYIVSEQGQSNLAYETVNSSTWYEIEDINFDGGDSTTYHTTWKSVKSDISQYQGKTITIRYIVYDVGDSIYDTAALIDNVSVS